MNWTMRSVGTGLVFFLGLGVAGMQAQQPVAAEPQAPSRTVQAPREVVPTLPVPRLVKFAGTLKDELGKPRTGVVGVTFAIYKEQERGAALWLETQNVELDEQGRYTVLLGSTKSEGLPLELFTTGEPRWLGVQVNLPKEVEQPRVLLVSVPYALKAADAETLGGKPLSSFVLASPSSGSGTGVGAVFPSTGAIGAATIGGGGTQNFVAKFDATGANVVNSSIFDTGTNVGIGTSSPARTLHLKSSAPTIRLEDTNLPNSFWELQQSAFVLDTFGFLRYENGAAVADKSFVVSSAGNLGIGTGTPQRKLHIRSSAPVIRLEDTNLPNSFWELQQSAFVLDTFGFLRYENGAAVASKSFVMSSGGNFGIGTGVPTQKLSVTGMIQSTTGGFMFPDGSVQATAGGGGTISAVNTAAGSGLMGGATSGAANLSLIKTCGSGQVLQWNGAAWVCASVGGGGTVTNVGSGLGLTGGPITTSGTLAIDPAVVPQLSTANNFTNTQSVTASTTASNTAIVGAVQGGSSPIAFAFTPATVPPVAVGAIATATTGNVAGVGGISASSSGYGVGALNFSSAGGIALAAFSAGTGGSAVEALAGGTSGGSRGIHAAVLDSTGVAGLFDNDPGGNILIGRTGGSGAHVNVFRVDGTGKGFFNGGTQTSGADFAESVAVRGEHSQYEPGDLLVIDQAAGRRLMLSRRAYSTRVAGIYSTKPGVLATTHSIDESDALAQEIPLAITGIVPCKVTAQNGPIAPGDLLVTSSTTGYAMKGTNRRRMLGAVVGKALEPLREGRGVIQVLVTLQ